MAGLAGIGPLVDCPVQAQGTQPGGQPAGPQGGPRAQPPPLRVICTGAVEHAVVDLLPAFTRHGGTPVVLATGNAGQVAGRVRSGERFDLVLNAAPTLDALIAEGRLDAATRTPVGEMRLAVAVREGAPLPDLGTADAVRATLLAADSIAHSDATSGATTGPHVLAMLERLGIAAVVAARRMPFPRGVSAAEAVAEGRATLVITQLSEIMVVPGLTIVGLLPEDLQLVTTYAGAVAVAAAQPAAARALLAFLTGPEARSRFREAGFSVA